MNLHEITNENPEYASGDDWNNDLELDEHDTEPDYNSDDFQLDPIYRHESDDENTQSFEDEEISDRDDELETIANSVFGSSNSRHHRRIYHRPLHNREQEEAHHRYSSCPVQARYLKTTHLRRRRRTPRRRVKAAMRIWLRKCLVTQH